MRAVFRFLGMLLLLAALATASALAMHYFQDRQPPQSLPTADRILVDKSERRLTLLRGGEPIKQYPVALGSQPSGPKRQEGDERTPEGEYLIDWRKRNSSFYRALHISYPNSRDRAQARRRAISPGGAIYIHGMPNGLGWAAPLLGSFDWTDGCIAVTNRQIEEIWNAVPDGTPITIRP